MSRYRKTMRQAIEEGLSNMQIAVLKKEYEPMRNKTITAGRAKQLMNILDKFKEADLKKLSQANIPFVSSGANSKMIIRKMKFKVTTINPFKEEVIQEDFDLEEGKMKTIATMFDQGKSAEEIAKAMKLPVKTIKSILGEEEIHEFKKMTVTFKSMDDMSKASTDLAKQGFTIRAIGKMMKVDGKGADLNKYATDLKNFYKADVRAESYAIDESADEDKYNPITEACWVGYKKVGMKKKGDRMVPNCVPEEFKVEEYITEQDDSVTMAKDMKKKKEELPKKDDVATDADTEKKEGSDDKEKLKAEIDKKDAEIQSLKVKAETEKAKVAKKETEKMVNPETGEPLLQVGVAYKHLRDKMKKMKEDVDYLKPKLNPSQIANIKKTWQDKKPGDVTPAVKNMIKNMDIPTQLAIKHAKINQLSKLVEDLGKEDEPKVKKIITKLKGASQAHAGQAKDLEKAVKNEMKKDDAYAIGMAQAKKVMNDEPPLQKKTIKKGHEIADKILKKEETILEFSSQQIKQAYGIANDPRYKQGNYSGAVKAIEKLAKGLSSHPDVQKVLKRTNENAVHPAKEIYEQIKGLKNKAEKSGMPYSILKKVYDRGMAAWRGGHRPGTSQQQWAFARVNSFITKSSGTWGKADKDLAAKVRGSKSKKESIDETGGAGEQGTSKLLAQYKKDTPGELKQAYNPDDDFSGKLKKKFKEIRNKDGFDSVKEGVDEMTGINVPELIKTTIHRLTHPKGYADIMKAYIKRAKEPHKGTNGSILADIARERGFDRVKPIQDYINRLINKGKLPKSLMASTVNEEVEIDEDGCPIDLFDHVLEEAEYQGKKVTLNDPVRSSDGKKKFHVYVKNEKGNVIKLGFGDPNMEIKRDDPARRKSFRARHNCDNPGPKYKARYWSCYQWRGSAKVDN